MSRFANNTPCRVPYFLRKSSKGSGLTVIPRVRIKKDSGFRSGWQGRIQMLALIEEETDLTL